MNTNSYTNLKSQPANVSHVSVEKVRPQIGGP